MKKTKQNAGYSLVELVIVLGIIAVLAGLATVTISSIRTARATSSKESFNQSLSTLQMLTKSQSSYATIRVDYDTAEGEYVITYGVSQDGTTFDTNADIDAAKNEHLILSTDPSDPDYLDPTDPDYSTKVKAKVNALDDPIQAEEVRLDRVTIYYSADGSSIGSELTTPAYIKFNKSDGSVVAGSGVYTFCKEGTTDSVGKVTLNRATGSHYTGS